MPKARELRVLDGRVTRRAAPVLPLPFRPRPPTLATALAAPGAVMSRFCGYP